MLTNRSCATLASVINAAAIEAAFAEKENIEMEDFVKATLTDVYGLENHCGEMSAEKQEKLLITRQATRWLQRSWNDICLRQRRLWLRIVSFLRRWPESFLRSIHYFSQT